MKNSLEDYSFSEKILFNDIKEFRASVVCAVMIPLLTICLIVLIRVIVWAKVSIDESNLKIGLQKCPIELRELKNEADGKK